MRLTSFAEAFAEAFGLHCAAAGLQNFAANVSAKNDSEQRLKVKQMDHASYEHKVQQVGGGGICWSVPSIAVPAASTTATV